MLETTHQVIIGDSADMSALDNGSVHLVVTSPPYPMVQMWDAQFGSMEPGVARALARGEGEEAYEGMHRHLDRVWTEVARTLSEGGIACVNIGDATRTIGGSFRLFPNHAHILTKFLALGLTPLPEILWRKTTNAPTKFMGSGTLPPGAYVTLEHEHILVFRKGERRRFERRDETRRAESAFFWEERNQWFSDVWELAGRRQNGGSGSRARSAAFPLELPYRLINMFSIKGDMVLDPFAGLGTTAVAAAAACRHSVSYELDTLLECAIDEAIRGAPARGRALIDARLGQHIAFVKSTDRELRYMNLHYGFPVVSRQEVRAILDPPDAAERLGEGRYRIVYRA